MAKKKSSYQVVGVAMTKNERDIRVLVKADNPEQARLLANKEEPSLEKHKDVRVYSRINEWVRVL